MPVNRKWMMGNIWLWGVLLMIGACRPPIAEHKPARLNLNEQWTVDGVPSLLSYRLEGLSSWEEKEAAIEMAYFLAHLFIGRDPLLKVEEAEVGEKRSVGYAAWRDGVEEKSDSYVYTGPWARVTLRAQAPKGDWSFAVCFNSGWVSSIECRPPLTAESASGMGFPPSRFFQSWHGAMDTNRALIQGVQVNHILAGVWAGETAYATHDGTNWMVRVRGVGMPGPETEVKIGNRGELLSFRWVCRE